MTSDELWQWLQSQIVKRAETNPRCMHGPIAADSLLSFRAKGKASKRRVLLVRRRTPAVEGAKEQLIVKKMWVGQHETHHETVWTVDANRNCRDSRFTSDRGEALTAYEFRDRILRP